METILIVDDEKNYTLVLKAVLEEEGYEILTANSGLEALTLLRNTDMDLVLTDMKMPEMDGMDLLEAVREKDPDLPVILMTAFGTVEKAVEAMQKGAHNFILKPFENESLIIYVNRALEMYRTIRENRLLRDSIASRYHFGNIIGKSRAMRDIYDIIRKVAPSSATVLIEGENGTGKELIANAIHFNSSRKDKPFIAVNCAALSEHLLESELFGHEKGAFTGATAMRKGRFELADGGTLFLDEIGEIPPQIQIKLLRVLQERVFERVGGTRTIRVDIRVIAATNKQLKKETAEGRFREDLFYRLNVLYILLPPLRERQEDIRLLSRHFLEKYMSERPEGRPPVTHIAPAAERLLYDYEWPGNIRELENTIERAMILCPGDSIRAADLPRHLKGDGMGLRGLGIELPQNGSLSKILSEVEKQLILGALEKADYVQARAARMLGIGKSGLNQKIKKYRLDFGHKGSDTKSNRR
ncbi:MAG: DNA-binding response regulator [Desulfobacterales bacterium]|nr:MAG: DNA-binding response regulator [Desulfobacterales bacterium]